MHPAIPLLLAALALPIYLRAETPGAGEEKPQIVRRLVPQYPAELRRQGVGGTVILEFVIGTDGNVRDVVTQSSPHEALSKAAEACVKEWKFKPGIKDGVPMATRVRQSLTFSVAPAPAPEESPKAKRRPPR